MIKRHSPTAIFMHWFNAICWLTLLFTGFGMLVNARVQPVGEWWVAFMQHVFGGQEGVFTVHITVAIAWVAVYAVYLVFRGHKEAWPFVREITRLSPASDAVWCMRKGFWLVLGPKAMRKMGMNPELPPQGFYNAGQKYVAIAAVLCSLCLVVSGFVLIYGREGLVAENYTQWAILLHFCAAGIMAIALPVHIYMAALAPGEGPALRSMFTGQVPLDFVRHHNPRWYEELARNGKIQA